MGKRGSRRQSTTSFIASVVVAGTSYQMLEVLAFCNRERAQPPSITITVLTFLVQKSTIKNSRVSFFYNTRKNFKSNLVLVFSSSNLKVSNSLLNDQAPIVQKVDTAIDFPTSPLDSNLSSE